MKACCYSTIVRAAVDVVGGATGDRDLEHVAGRFLINEFERWTNDEYAIDDPHDDPAQSDVEIEHDDE